MKRFIFCAALAALTGLTCPGIAAEGSAPPPLFPLPQR